MESKEKGKEREREWENTVVGQGYAARGVYRQPKSEGVKIIDMRGPQTVTTDSLEDKKRERTKDRDDSSLDDSDDERKKKRNKKEKKSKSKKDRKEERSDSSSSDSEKKSKSHKKEKKQKKEKKRKHKDEEQERSSVKHFNPLLQIFALGISDTTREFEI